MAFLSLNPGPKRGIFQWIGIVSKGDLNSCIRGTPPRDLSSLKQSRQLQPLHGLLILLQFSSVHTLCRVGRRENMKDDSTEIIFQSFFSGRSSSAVLAWAGTSTRWRCPSNLFPAWAELGLLTAQPICDCDWLKGSWMLSLVDLQLPFHSGVCFIGGITSTIS